MDEITDPMELDGKRPLTEAEVLFIRRRMREYARRQWMWERVRGWWHDGRRLLAAFGAIVAALWAAGWWLWDWLTSHGFKP